MTTLGEGRGEGAASGRASVCVWSVRVMSEGTSWCGLEWGVGWKVRDLSSICTWGVGLGARESFTSMWWQRGRARKLSSAGSG